KPYEFAANEQTYSSCVVEVTRDWGWAEDRETRSKPKPRGHAAHLLQIVQNTLAGSSVQAPGNLGLPAGTRVGMRDQVSAEARKAGFVGAEKDKQNAFRSDLSRALSKLSGDGFIGMRNDWIWLSVAK